MSGPCLQPIVERIDRAELAQIEARLLKLNKDWEEVVFGCQSVNQQTGQCISGASNFRKPRFAVWIGYDF